MTARARWSGSVQRTRRHAVEGATRGDRAPLAARPQPPRRNSPGANHDSHGQQSGAWAVQDHALHPGSNPAHPERVRQGRSAPWSRGLRRPRPRYMLYEATGVGVIRRTNEIQVDGGNSWQAGRQAGKSTNAVYMYPQRTWIVRCVVLSTKSTRGNISGLVTPPRRQRAGVNHRVSARDEKRHRGARGGGDGADETRTKRGSSG